MQYVRDMTNLKLTIEPDDNQKWCSQTWHEKSHRNIAVNIKSGFLHSILQTNIKLEELYGICTSSSGGWTGTGTMENAFLAAQGKHDTTTTRYQGNTSTILLAEKKRDINFKENWHLNIWYFIETDKIK